MDTTSVNFKVKALRDLLRAKGISHVCETFGVSVKFHKQYPSLAQFKYDQIKSDMRLPIPQVCRGIIVDTENDFNIIALPYTKFFNYGEPTADQIDWKTAKVYEKLDGSIITMYWHKDAWHVASSGLPDARGNPVGFKRLHGNQKTDEPIMIREEFWRIWKEKNYKMPTDTTKCFMFELMLNKFRNVVYSEDRIVLHGVRDMNTFAELDPIPIAKEHDWECAQIIPLTSITEVLEMAKKIKPSECEGFVVADGEFRRVKIKSPQYVALSLLSENNPELNQQRMLEIIRANEGPEFLAYFPHLNSIFTTIKDKFDRMCAEYDANLATLRTALAQGGDKREFAIHAQRMSKFPRVFFDAQKNSAQTVREVFAQMDTKVIDLILSQFEKDENVRNGIAEPASTENSKDGKKKKGNSD